jgi:hypothetical protein
MMGLVCKCFEEKKNREEREMKNKSEHNLNGSVVHPDPAGSEIICKLGSESGSVINSGSDSGSDSGF